MMLVVRFGRVLLVSLMFGVWLLLLSVSAFACLRLPMIDVGVD